MRSAFFIDWDTEDLSSLVLAEQILKHQAHTLHRHAIELAARQNREAERKEEKK